MGLKITSEAEFESMMENVDLAFREEGIPIHARPLRAIEAVSKTLNMHLLVAPIQSDPIPNLYEGPSLSAHILKWYNLRYGNRLKIDFSIGYSVIIIRNDAWLLKCPMIFGAIEVVCDRNLNNHYRDFVINKPGKPHQKPQLNLLRLIDNLPQGLANQLTDVELNAILNYYIDAQSLFNGIHSLCQKDDLALGAVTDFESSARFAIDSSANYGQSLWASLQAAEKILKYFIKVKGQKFPATHCLSKLAEQSYKLGLPIIEKDLLITVQCSASVRYNQPNCKLDKVVNSHRSAIYIALIVLNALFPANVKYSGKNPQTKIYDTVFIPGAFYFDPTRGFSYYCESIRDGVAVLILVESYQHGHLVQAVFRQNIKYQIYYQKILDTGEINRLKKVGEKIFRDKGIK
ncbi:HEPN domain-containing protein [Desulfatiglans anilini]|uniref:HEPN domain-containing protein n=1 Tax=Desulfatiglans anilini TaxID=90728 RepID=UPI00040E6D98|nr:HEPN domain-containing protein [Desulfatiglans anilini]